MRAHKDFISRTGPTFKELRQADYARQNGTAYTKCTLLGKLSNKALDVLDDHAISFKMVCDILCWLQIKIACK